MKRVFGQMILATSLVSAAAGCSRSDNSSDAMTNNAGFAGTQSADSTETGNSAGMSADTLNSADVTGDGLGGSNLTDAENGTAPQL